MKSKLLILMLSLVLNACLPSKKVTYNNKPVINANSDYTEYRIGEDWFKGYWSVAPQVEHDTLQIVCYGAKAAFEFKTDTDQIAFDIKPNTTKDFYVKMDENTYAHTIIQCVPFQTDELNFDNSNNPDFKIKYQTTKSDYLEELKTEFPLDFINDKMEDTEVVLAVMNWVHTRWTHDGNNSPSKSDAITILKEAKAGENFPCFAYSIVLRDQLTALGYNARTVYLKTKDAKNRQSPSGHVATEVYLEDLQKWVFVDAQFNIMPFLNKKPLNAVELQNAINNDYDDFELRSAAAEITSKTNYIRFVYDYLYYFDTSLDNRYEAEEKHTVNGKRSLMLVPQGAKNLTYMAFWKSEVNYCVYTNSLNNFYATPQ